MSRKKMITFDSDGYLSLFKRKMKQKEDVCFERMARLTNMKEDTVRSWFRSGRIPEYEKSILDIYLDTGRKTKKVLPEPKKEAEQMTFDELIPDLSPDKDVTVYHIEYKDDKLRFPKTQFFIEHAYDYDFTGDERVAYIRTLAEVLNKEVEVF